MGSQSRRRQCGFVVEVAGLQWLAAARDLTLGKRLDRNRVGHVQRNRDFLQVGLIPVRVSQPGCHHLAQNLESEIAVDPTGGTLGGRVSGASVYRAGDTSAARGRLAHERHVDRVAAAAIVNELRGCGIARDGIGGIVSIQVVQPGVEVAFVLGQSGMVVSEIQQPYVVAVRSSRNGDGGRKQTVA